MDELSPVFESVARYFSLLSEPTRLRILHVICHEEKSVQEVVELTGATQSNASRQLNLMYRANVLTRRKDGNSVYYRMSDRGLVDLCRTVCVQIAGQMEESASTRSGYMGFMAEPVQGMPDQV